MRKPRNERASGEDRGQGAGDEEPGQSEHDLTWETASERSRERFIAMAHVALTTLQSLGWERKETQTDV